jgi:hypothetical protein
MRKEPKVLNFDEFAEELLAEKQPRALVILVSVKIDVQLRLLIETHLLPKFTKTNEDDELLDGMNPLSTFSSRIKICRRLGLIDDSLAGAIDKLRDIRNLAAHWISFGIADSPRDLLRQLPRLADAEAQYKVIRNYFEAFKKWQPKAWAEPREYLVLRGSGLWAVCFIGAHVIDRTLLQDKFSADDMLAILKSGKDWDWSKEGDFKGLGGRGGALEISKRVTQKLQDEKRMSTEQFLKKILATE